MIDASVLIAYLDAEDVHHSRAVELISAATDELRMSVLTGSECLVHPAQEGRGAAAREVIEAIPIAIVDLAAEDMLPLAQLRNRSRLRLPDAAVLHLAVQTEEPLLTFDQRLEAAATGLGVPTRT